MNQTSTARRLLARMAGSLRHQIHKLYGNGWDGAMLAGMSEPAWLRAVWRWCGVPYIIPIKFYTPYIASFHTKKVVQDDEGVWWCETTYTPPPYLTTMDIRDIIMSNPLKDLAVTQDMPGASTNHNHDQTHHPSPPLRARTDTLRQ